MNTCIQKNDLFVKKDDKFAGKIKYDTNYDKII